MSFIKKNKIWDKAKRADVFSKALYEVGREAINDISENIDNSIPAGRTYRRAAITRKATKSNAGFGLRMTKGGKRIVGYKFHKASAKRQPPAKDTKTLYRGTKLKRLAAYKVRVFNATPYATHLEPPANLNRPFFYSVIRKNEKKYTGMIEKAARVLT